MLPGAGTTRLTTRRLPGSPVAWLLTNRWKERGALTWQLTSPGEVVTLRDKRPDQSSTSASGGDRQSDQRREAHSWADVRSGRQSASARSHDEKPDQRAPDERRSREPSDHRDETAIRGDIAPGQWPTYPASRVIAVGCEVFERR
jgi:hypothetical protein